MIDLHLENKSNQAFKLSNEYEYRAYQVILFDSTGREVPLTKFGTRVRYRGGSVFGEDELFTQEGVHTQENVTKMYDVSAPGTYYARAFRSVRGFQDVASAPVNSRDLENIPPAT